MSSSGPQSQPDASSAGQRPALRLVAIGGGTGLSTLLKGLRAHVQAASSAAAQHSPAVPAIAEITAVVTVSDDGGSSGRLRKEFGMLPPGDVRNCIVAMSQDEALLSRLFKYRFAGESALSGHNFGNLFLAALTNLTGDFAEAVRLSSEILATCGHIYPATTSNVELEAVMDDGTRVRGETNITKSQRRVVRLELDPADVRPMPQTLEALEKADVITLGPGSLFTSLIPNVLVHGISDTIARSPALKVFVCNLMTQANESLGLTAADHIRAIYQHAGHEIFDYALINHTPLSAEMKARYALEAAAQIVVDEKAIEALGVTPVLGDHLLEDAGVARHAAHQVAFDLLRLASERKQVVAARSAGRQTG